MVQMNVQRAVDVIPYFYTRTYPYILIYFFLHVVVVVVVVPSCPPNKSEMRRESVEQMRTMCKNDVTIRFHKLSITNDMSLKR